jgi:alpha-glucosidase
MEAVFSDETKNYVTPFDPKPGDTVQFRLRTAHADVHGVVLHINEKKVTMGFSYSDVLFDYYTASYTVADEPIRYYYSLYKYSRVYFYNKKGLYDYVDPTYHFRLIPGFSVPEWARGAVMYQIFVDRFYNGDPSNDVVNFEYLYLGRTAKAAEWGSDVDAALDVANFHGGDLQGVIDKMGYLKSFGVEALYLNPIFVSPSNHKYDTQDYDHVDPHYGKIVKDEGEALRFEKLHNRYATKYISRTTDLANLEASDAMLAKMIEAAHQHGIRVILDGVFNHCGCFNKWMNKAGFYGGEHYPPGAYQSPDSPYLDYFLWFDKDWPNNDCYDGWWGNDNHPKLNFEDSPALMEYVLTVAKKWVSPPFNADGWRLDVAADLGRSAGFNHHFWQRFREAVKSANPDAIILAEHYGDVSPWLNGAEWDTVMNYDAFMSPLTWFLTGMEKHSDEYIPSLVNDTMSFENAMRFHMAQFNVHSLQSAMNQLSNHDHSRFLTRTNRTAGRVSALGPRAAEQGVNRNVMMEAVVFQLTWPGAPTVYYGDEAGMMGWTEPDSRRAYPWGNEDLSMLEVHRGLIALRKRFPVLRTGSMKFLLNDYGFISFGRWDNTDKLAVVLNNNPAPKEVNLPVWKIGCADGVMTRIIAVFDEKLQLGSISYPVKDGMIRLSIPAESAMVLAASET